MSEGRSSWRSRLWRYGPPVLWMSFMFLASTGTLAASNTSRIIRPLLLWLSPGISEERILLAHIVVRKSAHFMEYAALALLMSRAFLTSHHDALRRRWFVASLVLIGVWALLDEYHQSFVPSRTGSIYDSFIDIAGATTALLLVALWRSRRAASNAQK